MLLAAAALPADCLEWAQGGAAFEGGAPMPLASASWATASSLV